MSLKGFMRVLVFLSVLGWANLGYAALTDDLVAYWPLDEVSGTRFDAVGSNHLTDNNTVTSAPGILNNAAQFVKADSEYLSIGDNADLRMGDIDFSVAGWVFLDTLPSNTGGQSYGVVAKRGTAGNREYWVNVDGTGDKFEFRVSDNGTTEATVRANTFGTLLPETWYFVTGWHDAAANTLNIQVNNGTVDSTSHSTGVFDGTTEFRIGAEQKPADQEFMDGRIDEVRLWKRVLTPEERTTLFSLIPDETPPDLSNLLVFQEPGFNFDVITPNIQVDQVISQSVASQLAVDQDGNVYTSGVLQPDAVGAIIRTSPDGENALFANIDPPTGFSAGIEPRGMRFDPEGNLLVVVPLNPSSGPQILPLIRVTGFTPVILDPVTTPTIDPPGGTFIDMVLVTLATATLGADIRSTTDGTDPTSMSSLFTGPFPLTESATLKARAFKAGRPDSAVASADFVITDDPPEDEDEDEDSDRDSDD